MREQILFLLTAMMISHPSRAHAEPTDPPILYPQALQPGDTIAIVAPAGPVEKERIERAASRLREMGFTVRVPQGLFRKDGYLAGSDDQRARELMAAFADPDVDAVFPGRGGYGTPRILDHLDFDLIGQNPKVFVGFSDITALHIAIHQRTGLVTFHSPNLQDGLGSEDDLAPLTRRLFFRAILATEYTSDPLGTADQPGYAIAVEAGDGDVPRSRALASGVAEGRLIGGNLSLVHALMGTPYEVETAGRILFLEDVGEAPYRVDRMLQTLKLAGKLDDVAGVVLGSFTRREDEDTSDEQTTIDEVFDRFFGAADYPVLADFPFGHQRNNATLPIGVKVRVDTEQGRLTVLENPVSR